MRRHPARAAVALLAVLAAAAASAADSGSQVLDRYFDGLRSLTADFAETMTDAQGHATQQATGRLVVLRPGRFRWETHPRGEGEGQLLVADGRNLWYYDRDLEQVTVKPEQAALTATPAMLLSGGANALAAFDVSAAGAPSEAAAAGEAGAAGEASPPGEHRGSGSEARAERLDWVRVTPKAEDADFQEALLGFSGNRLRRMILKDKLGETASIVFQRAERNAPVSQAEVSFSPPAGVDVIGKPER